MFQTGPDITVVVQWGYPQNDGGAPVDNYTSLWWALGQSISPLPPVSTFSLSYNKEYTVSIAATNCAGTGGTVSLNISNSEPGKWYTYCAL